MKTQTVTVENGRNAKENYLLNLQSNHLDVRLPSVSTEVNFLILFYMRQTSPFPIFPDVAALARVTVVLSHRSPSVRDATTISLSL